eukprot:comp11760_c0_seq1/m.6352 comp11760_c0_seq1/g.6352  ORF comp11760_c0_seq1/g.6352 comp11760_c0_seq1/m.6352 type:complete len:375 (-) comp11760_c0_seq1:600-1724(-)
MVILNWKEGQLIDWLAPNSAGREHTVFGAENKNPITIDGHVNPKQAGVVVKVYGFRGVRSINDVRVADLPEDVRELVQNKVEENLLLYTGHVGFSLDGGDTILGFQPIMPPEVTSLKLYLDRLKTHEVFPGTLSNDTETFKEAQRLHVEEGWNTTVTETQRILSLERYLTVKEKVARIQEGKHGYKYSFPFVAPNEEGRWFADDMTANCATFPALALGLEIVDSRGNLRDYIPTMERVASCKKWPKLVYSVNCRWRELARNELRRSQRQRSPCMRVLHKRCNSQTMQVSVCESNAPGPVDVFTVCRAWVRGRTRGSLGAGVQSQVVSLVENGMVAMGDVMKNVLGEGWAESLRGWTTGTHSNAVPHQNLDAAAC